MENLAVLIDFENIAAGTEKEGLGRFDIDAIMARIKDKGRILISRSYADWGRFARFKQSLLTANVTMMELTSHGMQDKNRADIAMVVDCLELAFTRDYIDTFIIVSGDSDFTPLVLKMRELNKRVIGIGTRASTSRLLINACDEFIFYNSIVKGSKPSHRRRGRRPSHQGGNMSKDREKALELLVSALAGLQRENPNPPHASVVKQAVLRRLPDFNENDLGFNTFGRFLEFGRDAGLIKLVQDKKSGGFTVDSVDDDDDSASPPRSDDNNDSRPSRSSGGKRSAPFDDPYYPEGTIHIVDALHAAGHGPLSSPTRMTVLEALCEAVAERTKKRRRTTIPFVVEDLRKRLRNTHGSLSASHLKDVLTTLLSAGALMHKDGSPIRSPGASFRLDKDAEALNKVFTEHCLRFVRSNKLDLPTPEVLADLFFGDRERNRDVEEILAWMLAPAEEAAPAAEVDLDDLDALLLSDDDEPAAAEAAPADKAPAKTEEAPKAAAKSRAPRAKKPAPKAKKPAPTATKPAAELETDTIDFDDLDDAMFLEEPAAPAAEPAAEKPAAKPKAKRAPRKKKAPAAPVAEEAKAADAEEAPKPKRKRAPRKKKPVAEAPAAEEAAEAAPAAKPKAKRAPRKKKPVAATEETTEAKPKAKRAPRRKKAAAADSGTDAADA